MSARPFARFYSPGRVQGFFICGAGRTPFGFSRSERAGNKPHHFEEMVWLQG